MIVMSLSEAAVLLGSDCMGADQLFKGISIDTRTLQPGQLFVAIKGESFDGHDFIAAAEAKGAAGIICSHDVVTTLPVIQVFDTILALGVLAKAWRQRFHPTVFAITGSNGKTTTKTLLHHILLAACEDETAAVLCSESSFNNAIGLPLTLFHLTPSHRYVVLELGMNHPGELTYLVDIAAPQVALVNNIGSAHVGLMGSLDNTALAKSEIFSGLNDKGIAVINADDAYADFLRQQAKPHVIKTFGIQKPADVSGCFSDGCLQICSSVGDCEVVLPLMGTHNQYNALAATTMALTQNIPLAFIQKGLSTMRAVKGRLQETLAHNGARLIDDTYNANPDSAWASATVLAAYSGKKIWVLGDMGELGEYSEKLHRALGEKIAGLAIDHIFTLGTASAVTSEAIGPRARHFTDRSELTNAILSLLDSNVTVLIKGSRFMQMEQIVESLLNGEAVNV